MMTSIDLTEAKYAGRRQIGVFALLVSSPEGVPVKSGERHFLTSNDADELVDRIVEGAAPLIETAIREQIAQELHDWAALHAGPDGAFFADLWERRIARGES